MSSLAIASPILASQLKENLASEGKTDLARQILSLEIQNCTFSDEPDVGYVYFVRPPNPVPDIHKEAAAVKETLSLGDINVDLDHENNVIGIEYICRKDIGDELRKYAQPKGESRLRKLIVNRFVDLRFTAGMLAFAAMIAYIVTKIAPSFSFGITFGLTVAAILLVGLSTLVDE
ncbi:MAG: DUF2283 domain-containing protein [Woeseiaceae bacterium]|nr:DUF2283 domain-containing protein [Woeseiaceae bacterium]